MCGPLWRWAQLLEQHGNYLFKYVYLSILFYFGKIKAIRHYFVTVDGAGCDGECEIWGQGVAQWEVLV